MGQCLVQVRIVDKVVIEMRIIKNFEKVSEKESMCVHGARRERERVRGRQRERLKQEGYLQFSDISKLNAH
jgi:hypothetical protein